MMIPKIIEPGKFGTSVQIANGNNGEAEAYTGPWIQVINKEIIKDPKYSSVNHYELHWNLPGRNFPDPEIGKPPHEHREDEFIFLFGADYDHPQELNATVEICLGEELEKHTISHPCCICIPAGTIHGFYRIVETRKPWFTLRARQSNMLTEHFRMDLIQGEMKEKYIHQECWKDINWN